MAMTNQRWCHLRFKLLFNIFIFILVVAKYEAADDARKVYIVYMGQNTPDEISASSLHTTMLNDVVASEGSQYLRYSYSRSFHGFSAKLTKQEAKKMAGMEGVVSVFPSEIHKLHTTRSWDFLGLSLGVKRASTESDVIIGVMDTGIWPESESFDSKGHSPPPSKWKGSCQASANFTCNNKIIGARYYKKAGDFTNEFQSPRDSNGHGTHTASTAAGNMVQKASLGGIRLGTARGGVPRARISVYKVCWTSGCHGEDLLAAFDDAISDGVDIISISAGPPSARQYTRDPFAIGSFHAMMKGILTSQSANNEGPKPQTTSSVAPWILSVAASTMESKLVTPVKLGNNVVYDGVAINPFNLDRMYPLIDSADAPNTTAGFDNSTSIFCTGNSLNKTLVKGKIVVCHDLADGSSGLLAGASGMVMQYAGPYFDLPGAYPLPAATVMPNETTSILKYIKSTRKPTAVVSKTTEIKDGLAPYVATYSGRGPNPISPSILKPDLAAPGVAILAAYSPVAKVSRYAEDKRSVSYNIVSGTSMACPHVSGVAAYIKSYHPTWSPAAIKSALMTTASVMNSTINNEAEFAYGAGHINPLKALDPGLIYDASEDDYVMFLCIEGRHTTKEVRQITGKKNSNCSAAFKKAHPNDLNYPSFVVNTLRSKTTPFTFKRTVTNVGPARSTYTFRPNFPFIQVKPETLEFHSVGEKLSYKLTVTPEIFTLDDSITSGSITWIDDEEAHQVRSPIVIHVPT